MTYSIIRKSNLEEDLWFNLGEAKEKLILRIAQDKGNDGSVNSPQVDVASSSVLSTSVLRTSVSKDSLPKGSLQVEKGIKV